MKRVAIYCRVDRGSSPELADYALSRQKETLLRYAASQGWAVAACYEDAGYSGATLDRPGLQELFAGLRRNVFDSVLVTGLDRLARSAEALDQLAGTKLHTLAEDFPIAI